VWYLRQIEVKKKAKGGWIALNQVPKTCATRKLRKRVRAPWQAYTKYWKAVLRVVSVIVKSRSWLWYSPDSCHNTETNERSPCNLLLCHLLLGGVRDLDKLAQTLVGELLGI
jgi:hypothetical protein